MYFHHPSWMNTGKRKQSNKKGKNKVKIDSICLTSWQLNCSYWTQKKSATCSPIAGPKVRFQFRRGQRDVFCTKTGHQAPNALPAELPACALLSGQLCCVLTLAPSLNFASLCPHAISGPLFKLLHLSRASWLKIWHCFTFCPKMFSASMKCHAKFFWCFGTEGHFTNYIPSG